MSEVLKQPVIAGGAEDAATTAEPAAWRSYVPAGIAVGGALLVSLLRWQVGGERFITDGALMMLALAAYLIAAVFYLLNLYAPSTLFQKIGLVSATGGVLLNLASWCVRWFAAYDAEVVHFVEQGLPKEQWPWAFRYVPFANLYDLSLAFAFGAGITTLLIGHRKNFRFIGAISLPLAALILVLARFIGDDLIELPPVLDSYWRPIHVGIASLSYGVALVCFAVAVVYLLKDGVKTEAMAIWASIFALSVFATVGHFSVFAPATFGTYRASTVFGGSRQSFPFLRADLPYVGLLLVLAGVMLAAVVVAFLVYLNKRDERARRMGHYLLRASLVVQALAVVMLVYQVKNISEPLTRVDTAQYERHALWMVRRELEAQKVPAAEMQAEIERMRPQFYQMSDAWVQENGPRLRLSLNANPVELAALITAFAATLFCVIFSFRTERLREALPPLDRIDSLMYKTAGVAFAGLALLLMTGAIWANESWGRYWGWDSKETGAFVAWLTYGGFLHVRISRGWTGRAAAYFAIVAFVFIIFTYLG
ncbi:MAG TPA: cytochrome c biogenesis protein CcsA, partial [Pyrinomonadaceae bacterium]|nr:cytochrome c biogenesis protein CcsA [Pyrinomonadaceae bacterium]